MLMIPLARTPGDEKGVMKMRTYTRRLERMIASMTPWRKKEERRSSTPGAKPGEAVVVMDSPTDRKDDPLYKGAKFVSG